MIEKRGKLHFGIFLLLAFYLFYIGSVNALPCDIYINSLPYTIDQNDKNYCLNTSSTDLGENAINFTYGVRNSTLDCNNYVLDGTYGGAVQNMGIYLSNDTDNNTVKNCSITDFMTGIYAIKSGNVIIDNNWIANTSFGIIAWNSNTTITNNFVNNSFIGIYFFFESNDFLSKNVLFNNTIGMMFLNVTNDRISNNNITSSDFYALEFIGSFNNSVENNYIIDNYYGIHFSDSSNNTVTGGSISNNMMNDYELANAGTDNYFTNNNFTSTRIIELNDGTSWFNYKNGTDDNIWLKTSLSNFGTISRKLISFSQNLLQWNDSANGGRTAMYDITGLKSSTTYYVTNNSPLVTYVLTTDSSGNLPSFSIYLSSEQNIIVQESTSLELQPIYSNILTGNPSNYEPSQSTWMNITWTDDTSVSTVFIECNYSGSPQNYTPSISGDVYYLKLILPPGSYYWKSYANDSVNNWNSSTTQYFTIEKGVTSVSLWLNGTNANKNYNQFDIANFTAIVNVNGLIVNISSNITGWIDPSNSTVVYKYVNLTQIGKFNITAYTNGNSNYSSSYKTLFIEIGTWAPTPIYSLDISNLASLIEINQSLSKIMCFVLKNNGNVTLSNITITLLGISSTWYSINLSFINQLNVDINTSICINFTIPENALVKDYPLTVNASDIAKTSATTTLRVLEKINITPLVCPTCSSPGNLECTNFKQTRKKYYCNESTNYTCMEITEEISGICLPYLPPEVGGIPSIFIVAIIVVVLLILIIMIVRSLRKPEKIEKKPEVKTESEKFKKSFK